MVAAGRVPVRVTVRCAACGLEFPAKRSNARWCGPTCRKRGQKAKPAVALRGEGVALSSGIADAVRADLVLAGRDQSAEGQVALRLAARLDAVTADTGASLAALSRELRAALESALAGGVRADDPLDELRARREARMLSA